MEKKQGRSIWIKLLALSLIVNAIFASLASYSLWQWANLSVQFCQLSDSYLSLERQLNMSTSQLNYYKEQTEYYSSLISSGNATTSILGHATIPIVAVQSIKTGFTVEYVGTVMTADLELREGTGRILVDTVPRIGIDIQTSVRTGVIVVEELTGVSFGKTDVILTIRADQDVEIVDGPSAGAAITVAILAAIRHQSLSRITYMTGTINSTGTVGPVGGIPAKALAAAQNGSMTFLMPKGQRTVVVYEAVVSHPFPGMTVINYQPRIINLQEYLEQNGYSTIVVEVETIEDPYTEFSSGVYA